MLCEVGWTVYHTTLLLNWGCCDQADDGGQESEAEGLHCDLKF